MLLQNDMRRFVPAQPSDEARIRSRTRHDFARAVTHVREVIRRRETEGKSLFMSGIHAQIQGEFDLSEWQARWVIRTALYDEGRV